MKMKPLIKIKDVLHISGISANLLSVMRWRGNPWDRRIPREPVHNYESQDRYNTRRSKELINRSLTIRETKTRRYVKRRLDDTRYFQKFTNKNETIHEGNDETIRDEENFNNTRWNKRDDTRQKELHNTRGNEWDNTRQKELSNT